MSYFDLKSTKTNTVKLDTKLSFEEKTILKNKFLALTEVLKSKRDSLSSTSISFVDSHINEFELVDENNVVHYYSKYVKECPVCRKEFLMPTSFKFCSEECRKLSYRKMAVMVCSVCEKKFYGYKEINKNPICSNRCIENRDEIIIKKSLNKLFGTSDKKKINSIINKNSLIKE